MRVLSRSLVVGFLLSAMTFFQPADIPAQAQQDSGTTSQEDAANGKPSQEGAQQDTQQPSPEPGTPSAEGDRALDVKGVGSSEAHPGATAADTTERAIDPSTIEMLRQQVSQLEEQNEQLADRLANEKAEITRCLFPGAAIENSPFLDPEKPWLGIELTGFPASDCQTAVILDFDKDGVVAELVENGTTAGKTMDPDKLYPVSDVSQVLLKRNPGSSRPIAINLQIYVQRISPDKAVGEHRLLLPAEPASPAGFGDILSSVLFASEKVDSVGFAIFFWILFLASCGSVYLLLAAVMGWPPFHGRHEDFGHEDGDRFEFLELPSGKKIRVGAGSGELVREAMVEQNRRDLEESRVRMEDIQEQLTAVTSRKNELQQMNNTAENKARTLSDTVSHYSQQIQKKDVELQELGLRLNDLQSEIGKFRDREAELQAQNDQALKRYEDAALHIDNLKSELMKASTQITRMDGQLSQKEADNASLQQQIDDLQLVAADLRQQISGLQDDVQAELERNSRLQDEIRMTREQAEQALAEAKNAWGDYLNGLPDFIGEREELADAFKDMRRKAPAEHRRFELSLRVYKGARDEASRDELTDILVDVGDKLFAMLEASGDEADVLVRTATIWAREMNGESRTHNLFVPRVGEAFDNQSMISDGSGRSIRAVRNWGIKDHQETVLRKAKVRVDAG